MDYLTEHYKNKCSILEQRLEILLSQLRLFEDFDINTDQNKRKSPERLKRIFDKLKDAKPEDFEAKIREYGFSDEDAEILRSSHKAGKFSMGGSSSSASTPPPGPEATGSSTSSSSRTTGSSSTSSSGESARSSGTRPPPPPPPPGGGAETSTRGGFRSSSGAWWGSGAPGDSGTSTTGSERPSAPPPAPEAPKPSTARAVGSRVAGFGAGLGAGLIADYLARKGLKAAGVENPVAQTVGGAFAGGAAGAAADVGVSSLLAGSGMGAAASAGAAAAIPIGVASVAGTLLGDYVLKPYVTEPEFKLPGETKAKSLIDRTAETFYSDIKPHELFTGVAPIKLLTRFGTNLAQGLPLNTTMQSGTEAPKGKAGGDQEIAAKYKAAEEAEDAATAERKKASQQRIAAMVERMKSQQPATTP